MDYQEFILSHTIKWILMNLKINFTDITVSTLYFNQLFIFRKCLFSILNIDWRFSFNDIGFLKMWLTYFNFSFPYIEFHFYLFFFMLIFPSIIILCGARNLLFLQSCVFFYMSVIISSTRCDPIFIITVCFR